MRFDDAVKQTPDVADALQPGIQALSGPERRRVRLRNKRSLRGSINLDDALSEAQPHAARWDYGVGLRADSRSDRAMTASFRDSLNRRVAKGFASGAEVLLMSCMINEPPDQR